MTTYLIKNVSVLGAEPTDLLLADGVVKEMGPGLSAERSRRASRSRPSTPPG